MCEVVGGVSVDTPSTKTEMHYSSLNTANGPPFLKDLWKEGEQRGIVHRASAGLFALGGSV